MRNRAQGKGIMLLNIDLEKAYDRVSWNLVKDTLNKANLPPVWVRNVMHYLETGKMPNMEWVKIGVVQTD